MASSFDFMNSRTR